MIDLSDLTPGCILVVCGDHVLETYPARCPCGCGMNGLNWAKHNNKSRDIDHSRLEFLEVVRRTVTKELRDSRVIDGWVVRKVGPKS
jgi:hypothetical protein